MLKKAYLEITNVCNLSCSFCPGTRREKRFMTPEEFETLSRKLRGHVEYLYLHLMGEPLLHPQLEEILGIAARQGFRVIITTNGTLLGRSGDAGIRESLLKRTITETLLVCPYITGVEGFSFEHRADGATVRFTVKTVYNSFETEAETA